MSYRDVSTVEALFVAGGQDYPLDLLPELALANDFTVVTCAAFVVLVVPSMLSTACLAIFAFIYPPTDRTWQYPSQVCPPSVWMIPTKWNIKNHVTAPSLVAPQSSHQPSKSQRRFPAPSAVPIGVLDVIRRSRNFAPFLRLKTGSMHYERTPRFTRLKLRLASAAHQTHAG